MSATDDSGGVPLGWVLLFVLIALGATLGVILYAGGGDFGVVLPPV